MAWTDLKTTIADVIKANGNNEITGDLLQSTLISIIDQLGAYATYKGVATPSTVPGTPDAPVFYLAANAGIYSNFGGFSLTSGFAVLSNITGTWVGITLLKGQLDAKANHGYSNSPKSLKQVDDSLRGIFIPVKNMFNKNSMVDDGHYLNYEDGGYLAAVDWGCTTPIKVKELTHYAITSPYYGAAPVVSFYDSNMILLSFNPEAYLVTTPAGCSFIRFSLYKNTTKSTFNSSGVQLEEGLAATPVVPYEFIVGGVFEGVPIISSGTSEDIYSLVFKVFQAQSNNLVNPSLVTKNVKLTGSGGTTGEGDGVNFDTSDFIPVSPLTSYRILTPTASLVDTIIKYYDSNKVVISGITGGGSSFTTPANSLFVRVSWLNNSGALDPADVGVFLSSILTFEKFQLPYVELVQSKDVNLKTDKEVVSKKDVINLISTTSPSSAKDLSLKITDDTLLNTTVQDDDVSITMHVPLAQNEHKVIQPMKVNAFGLEYINTDDVAPVEIQNTVVGGATYGWRADNLTCVDHGLTEANVGEEWVANDGVKFTIMKVISADVFVVFRENSNPDPNLHSNDGWEGQTSLTRGEVTLNITDAYSISYVPSIYKKSTKIITDGKEVSAIGTYPADIVEFVEEYDILNKESLRLNAANPSLATPSVNVKNTYRFMKGINLMFCRYSIKHPIVFSAIRAAQAAMISQDGYLYAPGVLPFLDGVDLRHLTLLSALNGQSREFTYDLWEPEEMYHYKPTRITNYTADKTKAVMIGVIPYSFIDRNLDAFTKKTFLINGINGMAIPHPVDDTGVFIGNQFTGEEIIDIYMFKAYFEPQGSVDVVEIPLLDRTVVIIDIHQAGRFFIKLSNRLNGGMIDGPLYAKNCEFTFTNSNLRMGGSIINSEIGIESYSDYAYMTLEIYQ